MSKISWIILIVIVIVALFFIFGGDSTQPELTGEPIKIGGILSMTGNAAAFGEMALNGINLAIEEINDSGGVEGRPIEFFIEDDETSPKGTVAAFNKLTSVNGVDGIIGPLWDFVTEPVFPLVEEQQIALLSPANVRIEGSFEPNDYSFLMLPEFSQIIRHLESAVKDSNIQKMAIVRFQSRFGQEIGDTLNSILLELGREPIIHETYDQIGNNDFRTIILKLRENKVDGVFLDMIGPDPVNFLKRSRELGFNPTIMTYLSATEELGNPNSDVDPALFEDVKIVNWEVNSDEFIKKFESKYNIVPAKSANRAYDAVYILSEAIANSLDRASVADYISKNSFTTINGVTKFTSGHAAASVPIEVGVIKNGKFVRLEN